MAQAEAPVQPLPPWMATTWLRIGPSSSTFVTLHYPQTYSGPSIPGLTWPWVYPPTDAQAGTRVSIIGGAAGLVTVGGSFATSGGSNPATTPSISPIPAAPTTSALFGFPVSPIPSIIPGSASTRTSSPTARVLESTLPTTSSPTSQTLTATPSETGDSSAPSDPAAAVNSADKSLSTGAIAGIVLAVSAILSLLLFLLICYRRQRRKRRSQIDFTMLDPEGQPFEHGPDEWSPRFSRSSAIGQIAPTQAPARRRANSPSRYGWERTSAKPLPAGGTGESSALISHEDEGEAIEYEPTRHVGPSIMLQSPNSCDSIRHCPSNTSLGTTNNADSTKTRASLISQFPVYDRRPSDHSSQGGSGQGGAGGGAAGPSASRPGEPNEEHSSGSGRGGSETGMFSSPPPRPPSRTRTVQMNSQATLLGLGRPPGAIGGQRQSRPTSLPGRPPSSPHATTPLHRNFSDRSSRSLMGAPIWLKSFTWLRPFFDSSVETPAAWSSEDEANAGSERPGARPAGDRLLPTATPVMRQVSDYRRVTTTAAAYDVQDLRDLAHRRTEELSEDLGTLSDGGDSASDGEGSSFLESSDIRTPPSTITGGQSSRRWSRATLGQPLQRISALSSVSLSDIPSIAESRSLSAKTQAKARRSQLGSLSSHSHKSEPSEQGYKSPGSTLNRAASRASMASHGRMHSSRSKSGSASEGGQASSKASSRRNNNSSGGSNVSSGHGSHRSTRSGRTGLTRVMENGEAVPPLPHFRQNRRLTPEPPS